VSVVNLEGDVVEVLASHGNNHLGGDDFDRKLIDFALAHLQQAHQVDASQSPAAMARLQRAAEAAKIALSDAPFATLAEEYLLERQGVPVPSDDDLLPLLGNLRYRLEPRLKAGGIALDWQVRDVPKLACLTPQNVLHILRILQEALTNVLKHARAKVVRVATSSDARGVLIKISDDGQGFDEAADSRGHGLASMRQRACAVGAELSLTSSPRGTTLSLLLPTS
jgi:signal transduction histidine kinase